MTKVKKPIYRETVSGGIFSLGKNRPVIVSIEPPNVLGFRLKGQRKTVYLTAEGCFMQAMSAQLSHEKREKAKDRKKRRKVKRR